MSRKCSVYCPTATLKNVVQSLVLSHLYYCPVVWTSAAQKHLRKLQIAQNRAARVALHCSFRASVREMHIKLSWLTVEAKVKYNLLLLMHKVMANEAYNFIKEKILFSGYGHEHVTRSVSNKIMITPSPRCNFMKKTIVYRGAVEWNLLPSSVREIKSQFSFKKTIKQRLQE